MDDNLSIRVLNSLNFSDSCFSRLDTEAEFGSLVHWKKCPDLRDLFLDHCGVFSNLKVFQLSQIYEDAAIDSFREFLLLRRNDKSERIRNA